MADNVARFREVADFLVRHGVTVEEVPGWERRGKGSLSPKLLVRHHTAGSRRGGPRASFDIVVNGRAGLRNALSNFYQPRGPGRTVFLVAARTAWHAGHGGWGGISGNRNVAGVEVEHDGTSAEAWDPDVIETTRLLEVALARAYGWTPGRTGCEHREWAPTRKVDRIGIDGHAEREAVAALLRGETALPPATAAVARAGGTSTAVARTTADATGVDMAISRGDEGPRVAWLQARLNELSAEAKLDVDGDWGRLTAAALADFQRRAKLPVNGDVLDPVTTAELTVALAVHRGRTIDISGEPSVVTEMPTPSSPAGPGA